jgi:hypothetical protein
MLHQEKSGNPGCQTLNSTKRHEITFTPSSVTWNYVTIFKKCQKIGEKIAFLALQWRMCMYFLAIWSILHTFGALIFFKYTKYCNNAF